MHGKVLIIAGSDSGGGAGIQADIKTVTALNGFAMTAITALTAQNTQGVFDIHNISASLVAEQIKVVLRDIGANVIKIGMLSNPEIIRVVSDTLTEVAPELPIIVDSLSRPTAGAEVDRGQPGGRPLGQHQQSVLVCEDLQVAVSWQLAGAVAARFDDLWGRPSRRRG